ncbi:MAG: hypothetical protein Q9194_007133 [Teloschistes cf. exilis]
MARRVPMNDPDRAIQVIAEDGGVILAGFSSVEDVHRVNEDAAPFLEAFRAERTSNTAAPETARCTRLFGRSDTARESWLQQEPLQKILTHFLRTVTKPYHWVGDGYGNLATNPILSAAATLDIGPGAKAQDLHRDDFIWQQTHSETRTMYTLGSDVGMGLLVAGVKTSAANGATLFVPGSHLWAHSRLPKAEEVVAAELDVGEAFMFLSSAAHAGGANTTEQSRTVHGFFYCRSYIRPEENQHLWWTKEEVQRWSVAAQKQAGYMMDHPFIGYCNEADPVKLFRANDSGMQAIK